jgi:cell division protein FtsA
MKNIYDDLIVGIDIGSSKIVVIIAEIDELGSVSILGVGKSDTRNGIRAGVIINIDSVVTAVNEAVEQAEIQAGREIKKAYVGFSGSNIETINSKGVVAISGSDKEIREVDIGRVIEAAKAVAIPMDKEIIHIIPQGFIVDGQAGIKYPIGMVGTRLECQIHILTSPISSIQNILKCMERSGFELQSLVLQNLASARSVLADDEKEIGVLMLDIGSETTKASVYFQQSPYFNTIYPLGGYLITNDLAAGLKIPFTVAEKIKLAFGVTHESHVTADETIQIPTIGGRTPKLLARNNLIHIIRPRVEEILNIIRDDLKDKGYLDKITGGIVLTGGTALLPGIADVCVEVFDIQSRVGYPYKFSGLYDQVNSCEYAVSNGLILWGSDRLSESGDLPQSSRNRKDDKKGFMGALKNFIDDLF